MNTDELARDVMLELLRQRGVRPIHPEDLAKQSYALAEAMMVERSKRDDYTMRITIDRDAFHRMQLDFERFQWLINQGVAWKGCYNKDWAEGEWAYAMLGARDAIDKAMGKAVA